MSIWDEVDNQEWADLATRTETFVERLTEREDLIVLIKPDTRSKEEKVETGSIPAAMFRPEFARIDLNASKILDNNLSDVKFVDPNGIYAQRAFPVFTGTVVHESAHAKHTIYSFPKETPAHIIKWVKILEETRVETKILEEFPQYVKYLKVIVKDIATGRFLDPQQEALNQALFLRYEAANSVFLILAREEIGILDLDEIQETLKSCKSSLGKADFDKLKKLWEESQLVEDEDVSTLIGIAEKIHALVDPKDQFTESILDSFVHDSSSTSAGNVSSPFAELVAASSNAEKQIKAGEAVPIPKKRNLQEENRQFRDSLQNSLKQYNKNPIPAGWGYYEPTLNNLTPTASDISRLRAITLALKKAQYRDVSKTYLHSQTPPGRLIIREAMNREAQVASNQAITATPWKQTRRREVDNPPITLAVASDISGSMSVYQKEVSSFSWAVATAVRQLMGKVGAVAWNGKPYQLIKPNTAPKQIPYYTARGGSDGLPESIKVLDGMMNLSFGEGVRVLAIITDGELPNNDLIQQRITELANRGVITLWILTSARGFQPKNATIALLRNPSDFGKIVGTKMIEALSKA